MSGEAPHGREVERHAPHGGQVGGEVERHGRHGGQVGGEVERHARHGDQVGGEVERHAHGGEVERHGGHIGGEFEGLSPGAGKGFERLLAEAMVGVERFGHREHVLLTWLAVRRHGTDAAVTLVSDGIRRTARYAGAPQKYHVTMSRAWVLLVAHHLADHEDFEHFVVRCPALLDKRLLSAHYRSATLASQEARTGWVEPDLLPLPALQ